MRDEAETWLNYAVENLESAKILLQSKLFNSCLQNVQQAIEKSLKAILIEKAIKFKKTHDILAIKYLLFDNEIEIKLSDEDCDFINSIYLPSKYPVGSALADYDPDETVCRDAIKLAEKTLVSVKAILK